MPRVAIYTAIYGSYDKLKAQPEQSIPSTFYCFTNNPQTPPDAPWNMVHSNFQSNLSPRLTAKWFKLHPHELFSREKYDYTIWIDGSVQIASPHFAEAAVAAAEEHGRAVFAHPIRDCIYEEAEFSAVLPKYADQPLLPQVQAYAAEGYPEHHGLYACGIIARKSGHPGIASTDEEWWRENTTWSIQDQLSLPVVLWRRKCGVGIIPGNIWRNPYIYIVGHPDDNK